jgi:hypothetical protein
MYQSHNELDRMLLWMAGIGAERRQTGDIETALRPNAKGDREEKYFINPEYYLSITHGYIARKFHPLPYPRKSRILGTAFGASPEKCGFPKTPCPTP